MRSKLFVPGSRTELFSKAVRTAADALAFDLEDSVIDSRKQEARVAVGAYLRNESGDIHGKLLIVRTNSTESEEFARDLDAVVWRGLDMINLPKVQDPAQISYGVELLEQLERERHILDPIRILVTIETARGLRLATQIAAASPRVSGLQLGLEDLLGQLNITRSDRDVTRSIRLSLRMAASESGLPCYDSAFPDVEDEAGFIAEAQEALRLGFAGKSCIHPKQIPLANRVFMPSEHQVQAAERLLRVAMEQSNAGHGAFLLDGRMIDKPIIENAKALVAFAKRRAR